MPTDKNFEFGSQTPNTTSANYSAGSGQTLMTDAVSAGPTNSNGNSQPGNGNTQMTDPGNDRTPVWQLAGKALIIILVISGLVLGGRWVWSNYSDDDSAAVETAAEVAEPEPLPINDASEAGQGKAALEPEPIGVEADDIPSLGPANPVAMTIGAAALAATLYRFSNLAHQPSRR